MQIVDRETGQTAQVWNHRGRLFVAGRPGARYSVRVTNNTGGRVLAVMSVDGVNILTGETAGYNQRGYVFGPYETYDVTGWRKSDSEVAAFTFAPLSRSYAARTGRPNDVGVIGVAVFEERVYAPPPRPLAVAPAAPPPADRSYGDEGTVDSLIIQGQRREESLAQAPSARLARPSEKLGTAHGQREWSQVTTVGFERATAYPRFIRQVEYDSWDNLVARGVIPRYRPRPAPTYPRPFPGEGYVPDPPYGG
ncbi:MAG TPA: hypothetical protein VF122_04865 [Caulobacteraceae bacterium]